MAMETKHYLLTIFFSMLPISELRGAIPYAIAHGLEWWKAYPLCVFFNALIAPLLFLFLETAHKLFYKWSFYRNLFDHFIDRARHKIEANVEKYGYWGVMLFVAIPLPITGAVTGTFGAWVLGLKRRKIIPFIALGVCISGVIMTLISTLGVEAFSFLIKEM